MADSKTQFKLNKLAKDLGLKSKDLTDILAKHGREATVQKTLEPVEFDILFDSLTRDHQIDDIEAYLKGETCIPSKKKPAKAKEAASKTEKSAKEAAPAEAAAEQPRAQEAAKAAEPAKAAGQPGASASPAPKAGAGAGTGNANKTAAV